MTHFVIVVFNRKAMIESLPLFLKNN